MNRSVRYTRADLVEAVMTSATMADVLRKIGLKPRGANYQLMWSRLQDWDIAARHIKRAAERRSWRYSDRELAEAIKDSKSIGGAIRKLGRSPSTSGYRIFRDAVKRLNLDTGHMSGEGWAAGRRFHPKTSFGRSVLGAGQDRQLEPAASSAGA